MCHDVCVKFVEFGQPLRRRYIGTHTYVCYDHCTTMTTTSININSSRSEHISFNVLLNMKQSKAFGKL